MIAELNSKSIRYWLLGVVLQMAGNGISTAGGHAESSSPALPLLGLVLLIIGTVLFVMGLRYYAMAKGRSPSWGYLGLLSIPGFIVLALLKDMAPVGKPLEP